MNRLIICLPLLVACVADELDLSETESEGTSYQGTSYQGTSYQGTSYQGTSYQGTSYQGTSYQGTSYQGATYAGAGVTGSVSKTTITTWRQFKSGYWEQRQPDRVCTWNPSRTAITT